MIITYLITLLLTMQSLTNPELKVNFTGLKHDRGLIQVLLFNTEEGFPNEPARAVRQFQVPIVGGKAELKVKNLPIGKYALSTFHDHDGDGVFRTGAFGIPKDPYGFSNDARGVFGPPSFEKAMIQLETTPKRISIHLKL